MMLFMTWEAQAQTQASLLYVASWSYVHTPDARYDEAYAAARAAFKPPGQYSNVYKVICVNKCGFKNSKLKNRSFRATP